MSYDNATNRILELVPEAKTKKLEVLSAVKMSGHAAKYRSWFMFDLHFMRRGFWFKEPYNNWVDKLLHKFGLVKIKYVKSQYNFIKCHVDAKLDTHSPDGWNNYQRNLDWAKQYRGN